MTYIVESICPTNNLITIYYRHNIDDANKWAQFLKDEYSVETEVYTEYDYMKLHPEKFYEQEFDFWRHYYEDAGVYDEEGRLLQHDDWAY